MISCDVFRARFTPSSEDGALLEHLRTCDACLPFALESDPDALFRSIGTGSLLPPGGVDAFVDDVMREVRLRGTETEMTRPLSRMRRLAVAATVLIAVVAGTALYRYEPRSAVSQPLTVARATVRNVATASRPAVEGYESVNATIIEVPAEGVEDVKLVMVFDESLPADL